jgi:histone H3/H4
MITKPSISRLARRAGVKSLSEDCYKEVNSYIDSFLYKILNVIYMVNRSKNNKTILTDDLYDALKLLGHNLSKSTDIGTNTYSN